MDHSPRKPTGIRTLKEKLNRPGACGPRTLRHATFLGALTVILALALVACGKQKAVTERNIADELTRPFESTVSIKYKEIDATAKIAKQTPGYCKVTFASPEALQDMAVEFTVDKVNIDYKKLHTSFNPSSIPGSAVSKMLVSAIDSATKDNGVRVEYKDDILLVTGQMEDGAGEFILRMDAKNGNLIRLSVPGDDFEAEFSNFNFIAQ
ncbi:hypothetical protein [Ligaoa zhengdingensis]|uniref:hypothetical protein n=1 Tax=Ligaoa zhengdingensis TaxID=2763658 RepID=UPI0031BB770C